MPLFTKRFQPSVTFYGSSTTPLATGNSNNSDLRRFRALPFYPSPQQRREITSKASSSSFRTSYVMPDDTSGSESDGSSVSDVSRKFWQKRALAKGNFAVDESSDSDSIKSETVSNQSYSTIDEMPSRRQKKEAYRFTVEGTGTVLCISMARNGQCWVTRHNDKALYLYHRNGVKKETKTISSKIGMICARDDKTVLAVPQLSQTIYKMAPTTGRLSTFATFELEIGGLCCTSRNETLLTTMPIQKSHKKGPRPRKVPSVIRLSQSGEIIWTIKVKGNDHFAKPSKVAVNINGDVCVLDHEPSREHLVILSPDGEEKKRYFGVRDKVLDYPFEPKDLCCDINGFIYITDLHNSAVHVLDKLGNFKHFLFTKHDGNQYPVAITCEADGFIWVGLSCGGIRVFDTERRLKREDFE